MTTRKTLKDFFQSRNSSQTSISINPEDVDGNNEIGFGDDLGTDFESGESLLDLDNNTTGLLGDYVSFLMSSYDHTNGTFNGKISNFYRPGPKNSKAPSSSRGNMTHSPLGADGNNQVFASDNTDLGRTLLKYSNSGYISNLDSIVKKEGNSSNNNILHFDKNKSTNKGETFIYQQIDEDVIGETLNTFKGYNRYYPGKAVGEGSAYAEKGETNNDTLSKRKIEMYNELGKSQEIDASLRVENLMNLIPSLFKEYTGLNHNDIKNKTVTEIEEILYNNNNYKTTSQNLKANLQDSIPDAITNDGYQIEKGTFIENERNIEIKGSDYSDFSHEDENYLIYLGSIRLKIVCELIESYFSDFNKSSDDKKKGYIPKMRGKSKNTYFVDTFYKFGECIDEGLTILFGEEEKLSTIIPFEKMIYTSKIKESKFFWIALFKSIIKDSDRLINTLENNGSKEFLKQFSKSRILQFANFVARTGDISLFKTLGKGILNNLPDNNFQILKPLDTDNLPDNLANIHGKNRNSKGEISWNQGSTPSLYMMPGNVGKAAFLLGSGITGTNPIKSALTGRLSSETFITPAEGDFAKIPISVVEKLENELEASYVPFYFHDLRTNEIISFHAFLNSLSDSITPSYSGQSGFGRMDTIQIYKGTTRNISLSFTIAATSKKDFNEMWWKLNKFITLLYPQWSKGTKVTDEVGGNVFTQPYSQVVAASPMIRMRVGDVIKSNYSELGLARLFGIGNFDTTISGRAGVKPLIKLFENEKIKKSRKIVKEIFNILIMAVFGSPIGIAQLGIDIVEYALRSSNLPNGDKIATFRDTRVGVMGEKLLYNSLNFKNQSGPARSIYNKFIDPDLNGGIGGPVDGDRIIIAATLPDFPYYSSGNEKYYHIQKSLIATVKGKKKINGKTHFIAKITDIDAPSYLLEDSENVLLLLRFEDFIISPEHMFLDLLYTTGKDLFDINIGEEATVSENIANKLMELGFNDDEINPFKLIMSEALFMSPYAGLDMGLGSNEDIPTGNPYTRAFNTTKGRGLPGHITSFSMDLLPEDGSWETDYNSRAPKLVKINLSFSPVHEITPGIDHSGFNTAPIYNVGDIMKSTSGDPWGGNGKLGEKAFKKSSSLNNKKV